MVKTIASHKMLQFWKIVQNFDIFLQAIFPYALIFLYLYSLFKILAVKKRELNFTLYIKQIEMLTFQQLTKIIVVNKIEHISNLSLISLLNYFVVLLA